MVQKSQHTKPKRGRPKRPRPSPSPEPEAAASAPPHPGADGSARFKIARRFTQRALKGKRAATAGAGAAAPPPPVEPTGPAAALDFISSGGYEAASKSHIVELQQALDGLNEPQLNLTPLHALASQPTDWTLNQLLKDKVKKLADDAAKGADDARPWVSTSAEPPQPTSTIVLRSAEELQRSLDEATAGLEKVVSNDLPEDLRLFMQGKVDALVKDLQIRRVLDQRAETFANEQKANLTEVRELLAGEIDILKKVEQHVICQQISIGQSMLFLAKVRATGQPGN